MITSYNEILNKMANDYYVKSGVALDLNSDMGARMQAVASELFSLSCYGDFVLRQAFPQTANSKYLESHAQLRDIIRKKSAKAYGKLCFSCSDDCSKSVKVPVGTVCSADKNPYMQFITTEEGIIDPTVSKTVSVGAQAINSGYRYNASKNTINVIVNPPASIVSVINNEDFIGGMDEETDTSLRKRILNSYSISPNGFNNQSIENAVLDCEGVLNCTVRIESSDLIDICVETYDGKLSKKLENDIRNKLFLDKLCNAVIDIVPAIEKTYSLAVEIYKDDSINENLESLVEECVHEVANSVEIEQDVKLSKFISAISSINGVRYCEVNSEMAIQNVIFANKNEILKNTSLKVAYYEQEY